jgi:hypothetical protein
MNRGNKMFLFYTTCRSSYLMGTWGSVSMELKRPGGADDPSPPTDAEVKNVRSDISTEV